VELSQFVLYELRQAVTCLGLNLGHLLEKLLLALYQILLFNLLRELSFKLSSLVVAFLSELQHLLLHFQELL